ncbi:glycine/sarcosine/betaine reductase complex component C subunit alpha [Kistimonas asteriae]|uniref:glycine/sarcosine/betaine reductase complex component C subunit alpha n=1 Tax=Kistimonas asteriae TaxID=517724 RepID=UPI001BA85A9E|nr:glycine/sarcosine/betaine reductase complex component C subunit alpha [Kistimonas asteriae]
MANLNEALAGAFSDMADGLVSGSFGRKKRIGLTLVGSEHGSDELMRAATLAARTYADIEPVLIGDVAEAPFELHPASDLLECHQVMETLLDEGKIDACVTLHYSFPLGVSTVGKVITPAVGREMILATTTGTSDTIRNIAMVKNAIAGIALAKATGIQEPTVGILNVEGAAQVERALRQLIDNGYRMNFTESARADGGVLMRGNDLLQGAPDVMVADSLTGNLMMKVFSSFNTGGSYEALGYGYGPGLGEEARRLVGIISRASGAPVIAGAMRLMADGAQGELLDVYRREMKAAKDAGLDDVLQGLKPKAAAEKTETVTAPPEKITDGDINGIDILDIETARDALWAKQIFARTGMGCTGPVVMVAQDDLEQARLVLKESGFIA